MPLVRGYSPNTPRKDDVSLSNVFPEELFRYRECRRALESELFSSHGRICLFALNALDQIIQQYGFDHVCAVIDILLIRFDLKRTLSLLDEIDRYIIKRLYLDGWTLAMVGESLGISHVAVFKRKNKALDILRHKLEE